MVRISGATLQGQGDHANRDISRHAIISSMRPNMGQESVSSDEKKYDMLQCSEREMSKSNRVESSRVTAHRGLE